jgi:hypothetical protein
MMQNVSLHIKRLGEGSSLAIFLAEAEMRAARSWERGK